jgi:hypothetical protein
MSKKVLRKTKTSQNVKVKNATPLTYDGIRFQSKLEVYCYKKLIENNIIAEYEKNKFTLIEAFTYNDEKIRKMTYTPDFVGEGFVIECKGQMNDAFPLRWKMFKKHLSDTKQVFDLYLPRNQKQIDSVINEILKKRGKNE